MKKRLIYVILFIIFTVIIGFVLFGHSVVFFSQEAKARNYPYKLGQSVNPFKDFNFREGEWTAYVIFSNDDRSLLPESIPNSTVIRCDDRAILRELQDQVEFEYSESDMATVTTRMLIFKDDILMFDSGLVVDSGQEGLQNRDFGWIGCREIGTLSKVLGKFKRVWSPIVIL